MSTRTPSPVSTTSMRHARARCTSPVPRRHRRTARRGAAPRSPPWRAFVDLVRAADGECDASAPPRRLAGERRGAARRRARPSSTCTSAPDPVPTVTTGAALRWRWLAEPAHVASSTASPWAGERVEQLALHPCDPLGPAEMLGVRDPDVGDDPDLGLDQRAELGDVAGESRAQLDDEHLGPQRSAEDGVGDTDLVVERGRRSMGPQVRAQRRGDEVLRRGLPDRAGDADRARGHRAARTRRTGEVEQRPAGVGDHHGGNARNRPLDDDERRPALVRVRHEGVSVAVAPQRDEHLARHHRPRVERDALPRTLGIPATGERPTGGRGDPRTRSAPPFLQQLPRDRAVVEGSTDLPDDLSGLRPLAQDHDHVVRARLVERDRDRSASIQLDGVRGVRGIEAPPRPPPRSPGAPPCGGCRSSTPRCRHLGPPPRPSQDASPGPGHRRSRTRRSRDRSRAPGRRRGPSPRRRGCVRSRRRP